MKILAFDTSNQTLAVGLLEAGKLVGEVTTTNNKNHSTTLMPAIDQLMKQVNWQPKDLQRIVVAEGPGSYTGLRIGVTTAKTLAKTLKIDLVGISSLETLAANAVGYQGLIVPLFDARRQNVYAGVYRWSNKKLVTVLPDRHVALAELLEKLQSEKEVLFLGLDRPKFQEAVLEALPQGKFAPTPTWDVPNGITLATLGATAKPVSEIDGFVPQYLKRVEAEEKWLMTHTPGNEAYVEKI
ncbi:tRNA (adenosine(37)-N6)-threonylcarbamoyltransferase complex dimerization subunit type 1 TsaB [Enterococcus asini]|uniref:tRNA (adenosine(37)-N6)-threonylcarbamoyltransferase complex dimerization subunit type 1 TsaB n=1 Tax=Enterococcus asini TaxID=57732 RepID=UPI00288F5BC7|nr:tRNA (adenosine(37)-N6)-threonylcarbamoyltransferase complex dimerization subunit type 1 TsaB [Enterococcus asini]MDT2756780.1 tRNA (adenosine(37)-N6)-threonylcarbamoyltransferase complex dimerization subunit type 1 TsaB [Enterococcus asini]